MAMECTIRPVEYRPALSEDSAAVITTSCMMGPMPSIPMELKNVTNGDSSAEYAVYGSSSVSSRMEPT